MDNDILKTIVDFGGMGIAAITLLILFMVLKTKQESYPNYLKRIMDIQKSLETFEQNHFEHIDDKLDENINQHKEIIVKLDLLRETTRELLTSIIRKMEK